MESDTMRQTLSSGVVVQGRAGLFTPADAYRLDVAYGSATAGGGDFDLSFTGDVDGALYTDASGTKIADLTIPDYAHIKSEVESLKTSLEELSSRISELSSSTSNGSASETSADVTDMRAELEELSASVTQLVTTTATLTAELENVSEDQKNYVRYIDTSTVDGSILFIDGFGVETYTVAGTAYETVTAQEEPANPDD